MADKAEALVKIEELILTGSEERMKLFDLINGAFGSKVVHPKQVSAMIKTETRELVYRVKSRLLVNVAKLSDIKTEKLAKDLKLVFSHEEEILGKIENEFYPKIDRDGLSSVDTFWIASNLEVDKLVSFTSELLLDKAKENSILAFLNDRVYKSKKVS